ncbi:MAG: LacI family DNA-binding transcriptional regulator [Leifsonia sp.]
MIGIIVPEVGNPYFGEAANEMIRAARAVGFAALIASAREYSGHIDEYIGLFNSLRIDGLICIGNLGHHEGLIHTIEQGPPVVVVAENIPGLPPVDTVLADDYSGGYQATASLLSLGHRRVAFIGGPPQLGSAAERERGWRDALQQAGIDSREQISMSGAYTADFGAAALSRLVTVDEPPTAVFAASDAVAMGVMGAAATLGIEVPRDLSIVGFDDAPAAALTMPRLTTVRTPLHRMAETAIALLLDRTANPRTPARSVVTPVSFVAGGSTAKPSPADATSQ